MNSFATKEQMQDRSKGLIPASTPFLEDELGSASALIREYCRWHVAKEKAGLVYRRRSRFREDVWLPASQIKSIQSVTADGSPLTDLSKIEFDPLTGWTSISARTVLVTYTAGHEEVPADLVTLTLQIAARALGNPLGVVSQQINTASVTYTQVATNVAAGAVLLPHEMNQLDSHRVGWMR